MIGGGLGSTLGYGSGIAEVLRGSFQPPEDATHGHYADEPTLIRNIILQPHDATHGLYSDDIVLFQRHFLAPEDALHAHEADAVIIRRVVKRRSPRMFNIIDRSPRAEIDRRWYRD